MRTNGREWVSFHMIFPFIAYPYGWASPQWAREQRLTRTALIFVGGRDPALVPCYSFPLVFCAQFLFFAQRLRGALGGAGGRGRGQALLVITLSARYTFHNMIAFAYPFNPYSLVSPLDFYLNHPYEAVTTATSSSLYFTCKLRNTNGLE